MAIERAGEAKVKGCFLNEASVERGQHLCGVLAFGSLIWEPGHLAELDKLAEIICSTPWPVEFARSSRSRHWAPTLVRVGQGQRVVARLFLYGNDPENVKSALADRERIDLVANPHGVEECAIECVKVRPVWYTALNSNIGDLQAECLARLAIASVRPCPDRNGIRYLRECMSRGVRTAMTQAYCREILRVTGRETLEEAEQWASR